MLYVCLQGKMLHPGSIIREPEDCYTGDTWDLSEVRSPAELLRGLLGPVLFLLHQAGAVLLVVYGFVSVCFVDVYAGAQESRADLRQFLEMYNPDDVDFEDPLTPAREKLFAYAFIGCRVAR